MYGVVGSHFPPTCSPSVATEESAKRFRPKTEGGGTTTDYIPTVEQNERGVTRVPPTTYILTIPRCLLPTTTRSSPPCTNCYTCHCSLTLVPTLESYTSDPPASSLVGSKLQLNLLQPYLQSNDNPTYVPHITYSPYVQSAVIDHNPTSRPRQTYRCDDPR